MRRLAFTLLLLPSGCDRLDMYDQPRYEPLEASDFFADGLSARPPVEGTIVRRGFRRPPSYHTDRLRQAPAGHFYDVVTNGFGAMPGYASRIDVADRWAIVAYIRALQLSQNAEWDDVPVDQRENLLPAEGEVSDASPQFRENSR